MAFLDRRPRAKLVPAFFQRFFVQECPDDLLEAELVSTGGLAQPQTIKIIAAILEGSVIKKREEVEGKKLRIVSAT